MNKTSRFLAAFTLAIFLMPAGAFAAKADGAKAKLIAKYDTNKNGKIDGDEIVALQKDFAAHPKGDLARFDVNHDSKLSDEEIAAIVPGGGKKGDKAAKKNGGKKPADIPAEK